MKTATPSPQLMKLLKPYLFDVAEKQECENFNPPFPPLALVTKPNLTTGELAYYLNRRPQTLRGWACHSGTGPMVPKRIGGLLAWNTMEAKALAGVTV